MTIVTLESAGESATVYELMSLLEGERCDGNIVYEIHDQVGGGEPYEEFVAQSKPFYVAFANPSRVDLWASNSISYAAKVGTTWFIAEDAGSNTYLGGGPTSTLDMRKFCLDKKIKLLYVEDNPEEYVKKISGYRYPTKKKSRRALRMFTKR